VRREDAEALALAGGEPARALVAELIEQVAALRAEVEELGRIAGRDSRNSSMPPSSDPPKSRAERRREARERAKELSRRKPGGQPGHEGKSGEMAAPEQVERRFDHLPEACSCGHRFDGSEQRLGEPLVKQKWELPPIAALVFEHRLHRLCCPGCGKGTLAELPAGVSGSAFGPRLEAHIGLLAGVYRLSRRQVCDVVREVFGCPISLGTGRSHDPAHERRARGPVGGAARGAPSGRGDPRRRDGPAPSGRPAVAVARRHGALCLLPDRPLALAEGRQGADRRGLRRLRDQRPLRRLSLPRRPPAAALLVARDQGSGRGPSAPARRTLGRRLVTAAREVIAVHRHYLEEGHEPAWLAAELEPLRERIRALLEQGERARHQRTARFCAGLLEEYEALWTFCEVPATGIDPTNNAAERALRHAVIMRKTQLGTQSERGSRWIERICSVRETCRLQGRSPLAYLNDAAIAAHHRLPAPSLVSP